MATDVQTRALYNEFREELIANSSIPGIGLRLSNELIQLLDKSFKVPAMDTKILAKSTDASPNRETFKEIRAYIQTLKTIIFDFSSNGRKWGRHELTCMSRITMYLMNRKYNLRRFPTICLRIFT